MTRLAHLAQRLFNVPLAIHPRKAEVVVAALAERIGVGSMVRLEQDGRVVPLALDDWDGDDFASPARTRQAEDRGYDLLGDVAIVPIAGTLVQKNGTVRPYSGMTGYDGIRQALALALDDPTVAKVALDIDSGGGEVAGCFDLVDDIYRARGPKPIWAILNEGAYSAAYAIASAADRIVVPRTGGTGSIGVICMHVDFSKALDAAGFKVTFITSAGADRKADGHSEIPLSAEALSAIQADIDAMGELFYATVARNRGLTANGVRDLKAATFMGARGLEAGLADSVAAPDVAFRELLKL
jgi:ClpP class serine protease